MTLNDKTATMTATITVSHSAVNDQIARITGYTGAKRIDTDSGAYQRISATERDAMMLERYWHECRDSVCTALRRLIVAEGIDDDTYTLQLSLSQSFDTALLSNLSESIANYFVNYITGRWMALTNGADADSYMLKAADTLGEISRKCMCKRPPLRPLY